MRTFLLILALALSTGCASSFKLTDGIEAEVSASPEAVGVGLGLSLPRATCSVAKAISWNWAENQWCDDVVIPEGS